MMRLDELQQQLERQHRAPTEQWQPPFCGDLDLIIKANGEWHYQGSAIRRLPLIRLFSSILVYEQKEYFLVTPVEKVRIQVEDLPFLIIQWAWVKVQGKPVLQVETNVGERYLVNASHPILLEGGLLAVKIRDQLLARVHRNVYYQWAEQVELAHEHEEPGYYLASGACRFFVGKLDI